MHTALNHMTVPDLGYAQFLDMAKALGCVGVEVRNDIAQPLFGGLGATVGGEMARGKGLRVIGISQVYPFNAWSDAIREEVDVLIKMAKAAGAETISLIPRNDGIGIGNGERQANLRIALREVLPMLDEADMVALVEPLGFPISSLRYKDETIQAIEQIGGRQRFKLVHDTFHHTLAGGGPIFPEYTGIVHISGVVDSEVPVESMRDHHRVLVDRDDRLGNIEQIATLLEAGYDGAFSYECFAPKTHAMADPESKLRKSFEFIASAVSLQTTSAE